MKNDSGGKKGEQKFAVFMGFYVIFINYWIKLGIISDAITERWKFFPIFIHYSHFNIKILDKYFINLLRQSSKNLKIISISIIESFNGTFE